MSLSNNHLTKGSCIKVSNKKIPVGISARHIHISREDLDVLFGKGYQLTVKKELKQPGQYAANEQVKISTEKGFLRLRILGPERKKTQVEISLSDALKLGINSPVRDSGDIKGSPGITVSGEKDIVKLEEGVIIACRHIHMNSVDAQAFGVEDKEFVQVSCKGDRSLVFGQVLVRVHDSFILEMHIDTDEGNAALLGSGATVDLVK